MNRITHIHIRRTTPVVVLLGLALTFAPLALAWAWTDLGGGDHGGADWTLSANTNIAGIHTNIGTFRIESGVVATVQPWDGTNNGTVEIHADTIDVFGTLSANGSGFGRGQGPGAASGNFLGTGGCGEGGGGAGYGGIGGSGGSACGVAGTAANGGPAYGTNEFESPPPGLADLLLGSGGAAGNGGSVPGPFSLGGGAILLSANAATLNNVTADGTSGGPTTDGFCNGNLYVGGAGGGSGGTVLISATSLTVLESLSARGGNGQPGQHNYCFQAGGGGGGAGGRIKILASSRNDFTPSVDGGLGGAGGDQGGGNAGTNGASGTVHVDIAPVITLLGSNPDTVECADAYTDPRATAQDDVDGDISGQIVVTGSVNIGMPGTYTLHYNVSDSSGNAAEEVTRTVIVADTTPPTVSGATASPATLWPPNHKMVNVTVSYTAQDSCSTSVFCTLGISSDEPVNGTGDGDTTPDWLVLSDRYVQLRAERAGGGDGREYSIGVSCEDASANLGTGGTSVLVPKSQKK